MQRSIEELLQDFAQALEVERHSNWLQGDIAAEAVKTYGKGVLSKFAEVGRCTVERIRQLVRIAVAFPQEKRLPDLPWSWYRAVYHAAKRTKREVLDVFEEALIGELSQADLATYGKEEKRKAVLRKTCEWCGSKVSVETNSGLAGETIPCPVCAADGRETKLGVLEVV